MQSKQKAVGRNDPCPCGSGKKYKQCCLPRDTAPAADPATRPAPESHPLHAAVAHHQAGRLAEAEVLYQKILQTEPNQPDALQLRGLIAHQVGKHALAIELINRAIGIAPTATMYSNLGTAYDALGKPDLAIKSFRQALALTPDFPDAWINLGATFRDQGRMTEAINAYHHALALRPDYAEAYFNLGIALQGQGQLDEAVENFQRGLALKPDYARGYALLGAAHFDLGQFDLAQAALSKALERDPDTALALALVPGLRKMSLDDEAWLQRALRLRAQVAGVLSKDADTLRFAVGKYYDDTKQYDAAFSAYQEANALKRKREGGLDRAGLSRFIDQMMATYTAEFIGRQREGASYSERPVLIVGMPRSGTSLTEQIIASHPAAYGAGELAYWGALPREELQRAIIGNADSVVLDKIATSYERLLQRHSATATRVVDKMPGNFLHLGLIAIVFPNARIIHTQRDPIDTCLSIYFQNFNASHAYATDLDDLAFYYREYVRLMHHWRSVLPPERLLEVPYEALTEDQEGWSRRIIDFLGLEWDDRCLDFYKTERKIGTASNWQVKQKIYQTSKARWRHYERYLAPLRVLQDFLIVN